MVMLICNNKCSQILALYCNLIIITIPVTRTINLKLNNNNNSISCFDILKLVEKPFFLQQFGFRLTIAITYK